MPLTAGTKLGPYEVLGALGAGGMGEVYRARDTRLDRTVAIKILPEHLASDPGRRARFEREARTVSGLSHPNICVLFDIGDQDGIYYVVLEYLEGQTLADRLAKGPLPVSEVLKIGADIASALESAHRYGIVHRDLKPANVMLTRSGTKLLDFGLAKPSPALTSGTADTQTFSKSLTEEGVILGTFQYMAPEQLEGKDTDSRTDIFALGVLLYEMDTGRNAFSGASRASIIAAIMNSDPAPMSALQPLSPPALERLVQNCLAKDPDKRWQTAHDVRLQLDWIKDAGSQAGVPPVQGRQRTNRERIAWLSALVLLLAVSAMLLMRYLQPASPPRPKIVFTIDTPPGYQADPEGTAALSPDGTQIAYAVVDAKGKYSLWVRALDSLLPRRLEGSESDDGYNSFTWTPDNKTVVALANEKLVRLSTTGGANEVLCEKLDAFPSTINREGTILTWTAPPTKIVSVSPEDCTLHDKSSSPAPGSGDGYGYPHFLPDGDHFLFAVIRKDRHTDILLGSLNDSQTHVIVRNGSFPKYIGAGYILFSRDGYLMAQKFDAKSRVIGGEAFLAYPNQLQFYAAFGWAAFDASRNGFVAAKEQTSLPMLLRWYDRAGKVLKTIGEPEYTDSPRLDAQETHVLVSVMSPRTHAGDIWSLDLERGTRKRETFQDRSGTDWPAWTPGGERVVYSVLLDPTHEEIFVKDGSASDNGQMLRTGLEGSKTVADLSSDGKSILYQYQAGSAIETSLYGQSLPDGKPFSMGPYPEDELPRFSPDGAWLATSSNQSGSVEIVVRPFTPGPAEGTQVSFGGGHDPRWSRDGKELFYRTNDWHLVAVPVLDLKHGRFGKPVPLFQLHEGATYDVSSGKRVLVSEPVGAATSPLFVIANWKPEPAKPE
jgi:eukaryotic-like serine/threonine-protein kinase